MFSTASTIFAASALQVPAGCRGSLSTVTTSRFPSRTPNRQPDPSDQAVPQTASSPGPGPGEEWVAFANSARLACAARVPADCVPADCVTACPGDADGADLGLWYTVQVTYACCFDSP